MTRLFSTVQYGQKLSPVFIMNSILSNPPPCTEDPRYNDSVCYGKFFCKIEFAVIKKLNSDPSKALIMDTFKTFF